MAFFTYIIAHTILLSSLFLTGGHSLQQSLNDGTTLVSKEGTFELGFFSPNRNSNNNRYLGIWYKNDPARTAVWVANRCNPINGSTGFLLINNTGNLVLFNNNNSKVVVWSSSSSSSKQAKKPKVELLESGNLVVTDEDTFLWQSFDYPSDTLLSSMKVGPYLNSGNGLDRSVSAWKNWDDPCPGDFIWRIEVSKNQLLLESIYRKGTKVVFRSGPWNGVTFSGAPALGPNMLFTYSVVHNDKEAYFTMNIKNRSTMVRALMNQTTTTWNHFTWIQTEKTWRSFFTIPSDKCDHYNACGPNTNCVVSDFNNCQCLKGFKPKSEQQWSIMDWSQGCERNTPLICQDKYKDGFVKLDGVKLPDTVHSWVNNEIYSLNECRKKCLENCSCMAYSNIDIRGEGSGCIIWFGDLIDIRQMPGGTQDLYFRLPESEIEREGQYKVERTAVIVAAVGGVCCIFILIACCIYRRQYLKDRRERRETVTNTSRGEEEEDMELPLFKLSTINTATDFFSFSNKLGEGGFGPVYRGMLEDGQQIAVKRLSLSSGQGVNEFKNEVKLIAKLQHRNLVRLLGCCIEGEENMLIYEYMSNKSLDFFIFDQKQETRLDWSTRFQIICGIARGLLYLHQDSRLRIIHRDLKASNVLLDDDMNPKISDFGLARIFGGDQIEDKTSKVIGTYGYMAPEYISDGLFSVKSDVFSFGILVLEIVSGKKNRGFPQENNGLTLIGYAWTLLKESRLIDLGDKYLINSNDIDVDKMLRCIHIGLLCVQQISGDRPNMSSVIFMLNSQNKLPEPKAPAYFMQMGSIKGDTSSSKPESSSTNDISITLLDAR
uniref:Receptor-like serine/threonine-protein kinase n=1 Tax=Cannabis sativa TaxID=3483 RepID=A0A803QL59_CANSA